MASPAQVTANRANAQLSTGPLSVEGKAAASRNSLKLGITAQSMIIPGEDPAALEQLAADYHRQFEPVGPVETALLETIIRAQWMQQRCDRIESAYLNARIAALPEGTENPMGAAMILDAEHGNTLQKIFRRQQATLRDWNRAIEQLYRIQADRREQEEHAEVAAITIAKARATANRVRFDSAPQPDGRPAPAPLENLALRL